MVLAALAALLRILIGDRVVLAVPNVLLLALVVVILLGAINAPDYNRALHAALMWGAFAVGSLVIASAPLELVRRVLICLVFAAGAVGVLAIAKGGNQELVQGGQDAVGRVGVVFDHPNFLAYFMILALPQAIVLFRLGSPAARALALVAILPMVIGLMLTLSRTGIVGALVALLVLLAWSDFRRIVIVLIVAVGAYGIVNQGAISRSKEISLLSKRLATVGGGSTVQRDARPTIWRAVPGIVAEHPLLGAGAGNFALVSRRNGLFGEDGGSYVHAHDLLLTIAAELGLAGLAVFLALMGSIGRMAAAGWRSHGPNQPWVISLTASLVGLFVAGIGDYPASNNAIWATTLVVIGALVAFVRHDTLASRDPRTA
jgi:O-antigen ligase